VSFINDNCAGEEGNDESCWEEAGDSEQEVQAVENFEPVFCHDLTMHCRVFSAIAVITQLAIENGEPLFQVDYDDNLDEE
jgi:hypothetical protein